ncbi:hypothetical protein VE00_09949 [Pseudogymnoascus sp. WSF 3629]|nr:hypothetical protein VE00_09949 [Pseudogymnoascus sp. WSF 3629]
MAEELPASANTFRAVSPPPPLSPSATYDNVIASLVNDDLPPLPSSEEEDEEPVRYTRACTATIRGTSTPSLSSHSGSPKPEDTRGRQGHSPELGDSAPSRQVMGFGGRAIPPVGLSGVVTALAALPIVRDVFVKNTSSFTLARPANAEAWVAQHVGKEASSLCDHCGKGSGPFGGLPCVVVDDHLGGSCASCHYNSSGRRCSFQAVDLTADDGGDGGGGGRVKRMASEPLGGKPAAPALCRKGKKPLKKAASPTPSPASTCTTTRGRSAFSPGPDTPPHHHSRSPTMSRALPPSPGCSRLALPAAPTLSHVARAPSRAATPPMEPELARQLVLVRALPAVARPAHR